MAHERLTHTIHRASVLVDPLPVLLRPGVPSNPAELRLEAGKCIVGSGSRAQLVIDSPTVSRAHAELTLVPEGVLVKDLDSRNGTFYLGQRIGTAILAPGTRIMLGQAPLAIDLDSEHIVDKGSPLKATSFRGMVGSSSTMLRLFTMISRLDGSLVPVLVQGESGVGKELVARALHEGSRVSSGPFLAVSCGAIPRELVASTLFGHRKGAFTGASEARKGSFVAADGGTLFLDEIGELPLDVQPTLLRALETGEVASVGEDAPRKVRVRIVAATHRDLASWVKEGKFREDLYYRLAVVSVAVPPLRDRVDDIGAIARLFARQEGVSDLDDELIEALKQRSFPGNVRELRNAVLTYTALGTLATSSESIAAQPRAETVASLSPNLDVPYLEQRDALVLAFTRKYVAVLLERTRGNQSEAARIAGLDRTYFGRLLAKLGRPK
jgi:two-component system, NtrC family, response regulator GlrR